MFVKFMDVRVRELMKSQENCYLAMVLQCFGRRQMAGGATEAKQQKFSLYK